MFASPKRPSSCGRGPCATRSRAFGRTSRPWKLEAGRSLLRPRIPASAGMMRSHKAGTSYRGTASSNPLSTSRESDANSLFGGLSSISVGGAVVWEHGVLCTVDTVTAEVLCPAASSRRLCIAISVTVRLSSPADHATLTVAERACRTADWLDPTRVPRPCRGVGGNAPPSFICWRITRPTTTGCARTLRSTRMLRSIDLRRHSGLSHQSLGSAVSIGTTFGWHNRYTQVAA